MIIISILCVIGLVVSLIYLQRVKNQYGSLKFLQEQVKELAERKSVYDAFIQTELQKVARFSDEQALRIREAEQNANLIKSQIEQEINECKINAEIIKANLQNKTELWESSYNALINPLINLEQNKDQRHANCLKLTNAELEDIEYLFSTVMVLIDNKDIIAKVIWSGYLQKPLNDMLKAANVEDKAGIYKITNVETNKCYIGQSTNVKKRLQDHFKAVYSIDSQPFHKQMQREGIENFQIEVICYCDREELDAREAFYIKEFRAQEYGYNILAGNGETDLWKTT